MKKISLCVIVIMVLGVTLIAQESEPSAIVGYVAYECLLGEGAAEGRNSNLIAFPLEDTLLTNTSELGARYPNITAVFGLNPATQVWTMSTPPLEGDEWENEFAILPGHAYLITIDEAFTHYSVGTLPELVQFDLQLGEGAAEGRNSNTIMVPLDMSNLSNTSLLGADIEEVNAIFSLNPVTQVWTMSTAPLEGEVWENQFDTPIGMPLMITVTDELLWPPAEDGRDQDWRRRLGVDGRTR